MPGAFLPFRLARENAILAEDPRPGPARPPSADVDHLDLDGPLAPLAHDRQLHALPDPAFA
jgi:hypothetical protein